MSESKTEILLSDQACGAVMLALQNSLLEQSDIVPVLKGFRFKLSERGLMVMNPPIVRWDEDKLFEEKSLDPYEMATEEEDNEVSSD
tara:strand:+ start:107 stop:367 length:261 start_codon:yes stop_codon:yes gene_type:complete